MGRHDEVEKLTQLGCRKRNGRVSRSVVEPDLITFNDPSTRKHHAGDVPFEFIAFRGPEDPLLRTPQDLCRIGSIQQRQPESIETTSSGVAHSVIEDQPSLRCLQRRRRQSDLPRVPPAAQARRPRWTPENRPSIDSSKPAITGVVTETVQLLIESWSSGLLFFLFH
jgi:hypothetical protein